MYSTVAFLIAIALYTRGVRGPCGIRANYCQSISRHLIDLMENKEIRSKILESLGIMGADLATVECCDGLKGVSGASIGLP